MATLFATTTMVASMGSLSASALNPNGKQWYIPKSVSSNANETLTYNADLFSFKVTNILKGDKTAAPNYKRIRIKASSNSSSTAWLQGTGFSGTTGCTVLTGRTTKTMTFQAYLGTYCEIAPATFSSAKYSFYYYGNDPELDAYATIESDYA